MSTKEILIGLFPKLADGDFEITSPVDKRYNCVAWAAGSNDGFWDPKEDAIEGLPFYWPGDLLKNDYSLDNYRMAFERHEFQCCDNDRYEEGFEKIALFLMDGLFSHAARQIGPELWTSKLGGNVDIQHYLYDLEGDQYGKVALFMKRPREKGSQT